MGSEREIRIEYGDQQSLERAWRNYIKHGALVARAWPPPKEGDRVRVVLHPQWEGPDAILGGSVVQASSTTTVLQLDPLDAGARAALVANGIQDAAPDLDMEVGGPPAEEAPTVDEGLAAATRESETASGLVALQPEPEDRGWAPPAGDEPVGLPDDWPLAEDAGPRAWREPVGGDPPPTGPEGGWHEGDVAPRSWEAGPSQAMPSAGVLDEWAPEADQSLQISVDWLSDAAAMPDPGAAPALRPIRQASVSWERLQAVGPGDLDGWQGAEPARQDWGSPAARQDWGAPAAQQDRGSPAAQQDWGSPAAQQGWQDPSSGPRGTLPEGEADETWQQDPDVSAGFDVRQVSQCGGPATTGSEALLPAPTDRGDLGSKNWRDTLLGLFMARATGVVVIHAFREIRWAYMVDGRPVHYLVDHTHPGEYLSDALVRDGLVDGRQWCDAVRAGRLSGLLPGEILVRRGALQRSQLEAALVARAAAVTRNLIGANFGNWTLHPWPEVRELFPWEGVDVLGLLLKAERAAKARLTDEEITKETEPLLDRHIALVPERASLLGLLEVNATEGVLVKELLPGGWTMKELMVYGGMREKDLLRFVWVLRAMGFVELKKDEGPQSKRNRAERILYVALRDITRRGDFEALHCHWTAIEEEVMQGYQRILKEFGRERFQAVLDSRLEELIDRIKARADQAFASVSTLEGRTTVRKVLVGEAQLIMAADLMAKQADMEVYKANFKVARACFERVLELAPKIPETSEQRAQARAQIADPRIGGAGTLGADELAAVTQALDEIMLE